jgi:fimbrial isopeptide formation D2 family protein/uncharacterized repeat protein (TIGR01451 family)
MAKLQLLREKSAMKKDIENKIFRVGTLVVFLTVAISVTILPESADAKSLYVLDKGLDYLAQWENSSIEAYDIGTNGTINFQADANIPHWASGAVGITMDSDSQTLFMIFEYDYIIVVIDATTLKNTFNMVAIPGVKNLSGVVYDHSKHLVYTVDKGKANLYAYKWNPVANALMVDANYPVVLENATAYGLALDEIDHILYVTNGTKNIYAYSTADWSLKRTINVNRPADNIAVDVNNGYLYTGAGKLGNQYLTQYHLATNTEKEVKVTDNAGVAGICVDPESGMVYISTGNEIEYDGTEDSNDLLVVYNKNLSIIDVIDHKGNPSGLVIPGKDVGYNPLNLNKAATSGVVINTENGVAQLDDENGLITYTISFNTLDINAPVTDVVVTDNLPAEVNFVSVEANDSTYSIYDSNNRTYTWVYSSMKAAVSKNLKITVQADKGLASGMVITNYVTINSNETPPTTRSVNVIKTSSPLYIKKSVFGTAEGQIKKVSQGEVLRYRIYFDSIGKDFTSTGISIVDKLPAELTFISADHDSIYGSYNADKHIYTWLYPNLKPGTSAYVDIIVKVKDNAVPGKTITNSVTIDCAQTPPASSSVDIITNINTLYVTKSVTGAYFDGTAYKVGAEETVTYNICIDSNEGKYPFTNVRIVDTLPEDVTFVSADGDGTIGSYDSLTHKYTWTYATVLSGTTKTLLLKAKVKKDVSVGATITNSVTLTCDEAPSTSSTAVVVIRQNQLKATSLQITPSTLRRTNGTAENVTAVLQLPSGYNASDVKNSLLVMYPGNIKPASQQITSTAQGAKITAVFKKSDILNAISGYGQFKVTIVGTLQSGQDFYGEQNIWISRFTGH